MIALTDLGWCTNSAVRQPHHAPSAVSGRPLRQWILQLTQWYGAVRDGHAPYGLEQRYELRVLGFEVYNLKCVNSYEMKWIATRKKHTILWDLRNNYNHEKGISRLAIIKIWYNPLKELWLVTRISETTGRFQKQQHKVWACNDFEIMLVFMMLIVIIIYYYHLNFLIYFADEAFDHLKARFCIAPILKVYDPTLPTRVKVDASGFATGGILSQKHMDGYWHPVAYHSESMSKEERNYEIYDREMLGAIRALEDWRHFLEGNHSKL